MIGRVDSKKSRRNIYSELWVLNKLEYESQKKAARGRTRFKDLNVAEERNNATYKPVHYYSYEYAAR